MKKSILDQCENMFGSLQTRPDIKKRIYAYLENPTFDNWDDIKGIIITPRKFASICQAVVAYDPTFPQQGRKTDESHNIIKEWERIPTAFEVMKAIQQFIQ